MRLTTSRVGEPGITRRRYGRGFRYTDAQGEPVTDTAALKRIEELVIPPAWRRVWICTSPQGHIQAVGYDSAGRRQYLYHPQWRRERDEEKHDRVRRLARRLPGFREAVARDLAASGAGRDRMLAVALRILDTVGLRSGGEEYLADNGSRGLSTLADEHVEPSDDTLRLCFPAKSGVRCDVEVVDAELARAVRAVRRSRGSSSRFLSYRDAGGRHQLSAEDVNSRFKDLTGEEFTVKDLRTWHATVTAAVVLAEAPAPGSRTAAKRAVAAAMRAVAEELGNTPAVARKSYVDPRVVSAFESGRTIAAALRRSRRESDPGRASGFLDRAVVRLIGAG